MRFLHALADVAQLIDRRVLKPLAAPIEMLVNLDGRFLHHGMRFLTAADEDEVVAASEPRVPVFVIEGHAKQRGRFAGRIRSFHGFRWKYCLSMSAAAVRLLADVGLGGGGGPNIRDASSFFGSPAGAATVSDASTMRVS